MSEIVGIEKKKGRREVGRRRVIRAESVKRENWKQEVEEIEKFGKKEAKKRLSRVRKWRLRR